MSLNEIIVATIVNDTNQNPENLGTEESTWNNLEDILTLDVTNSPYFLNYAAGTELYENLFPRIVYWTNLMGVIRDRREAKIFFNIKTTDENQMERLVNRLTHIFTEPFNQGTERKALVSDDVIIASVRFANSLPGLLEKAPQVKVNTVEFDVKYILKRKVA